MELADTLRAAFPGHARKLPRFRAPNWLMRVIGLCDKDVRDNLGELGARKRTEASDSRTLLGRPSSRLMMQWSRPAAA